MRELVAAQNKREAASQRRTHKNESITDPDFVFFHLAKNGGGSISQLLRPIRMRWYHAGHRENLPDLATRFPNAPIFFFVRHPVSRFVSGFYNMHRARMQGVPRLPNKSGVVGFHLFSQPDQLARAVASTDEWERSAAEYAMGHLPFLRNPMVNNLISTDVVDAHRHRIAFIGLQENFAASVDGLRRALSLPERLTLPTEDLRSHRSPDSLRTAISDEGRAALLEWYRDDLVLYEHCRAIHLQHMEKFG